jgi:hypothetical protein
MQLKIAENIDTHKWNLIRNTLESEGWLVVNEYINFDKGIDFDSYKLKKGNEIIILEWDNWIEGEIKCSEKLLKFLKQKFQL